MKEILFPKNLAKLAPVFPPLRKFRHFDPGKIATRGLKMAFFPPNKIKLDQKGLKMDLKGLKQNSKGLKRVLFCQKKWKDV